MAYQSREGGDFAFGDELTAKRAALAVVEKALASDVDDLNEPRAVAA